MSDVKQPPDGGAEAPTTLYAMLGGETALRQLVDRFYDLMDELPEAATIRAMHPPDLGSSRQKLFEFLSGWTGGPPLYIEKYGHPRLRARHLPFAVDVAARDAWMRCMAQALDEVVQDEGLARMLQEQFAKTADFMRNQAQG